MGGLIAGFLGLGGGIFYILVFPYILVWFGIPSENASSFVVANSMIGIAFASGISLVTLFKKVKLYINEIFYIAIPAIITSLLTTIFIVHSSWFSKELFNIFVIILMLFILVQMQLKNRRKTNQITLDQNIKPAAGGFSGGISGFISALSGLGGGIIIIPILQIRLNQSTQKAKIISLAIIFISATFISVQNLLSQPNINIESTNNIGYIIPSLMLPIIIGTLIGSPIGVKLSWKLKDQIINTLFSIFVLIVLIEKLVSLF